MNLRNIAVLLLCAFLTACQTMSFPEDAVPLSEVHAQPIKFKDTPIKVCGFATKQFENVQITESRGRNWRYNDVAGLGVKWLSEEPYTNGPEQRCITGLVEPNCGWENLKDEDVMCVSTGSNYQWSIHQNTSARD